MSDINVTVQDEIVNIDVIDEPVLVNVVNSPGQQGPAGQGVPVGGTAGQILAKASATDYDTEWINNYAKYLATNVRNQTGSTIGAFQVVYISGATGNKPLISLADADTEATSSKTYGVTATSIANNGTGDVVTAGELSGINTSAFNEGDLLWLSTTAGGVVTSPPAEPAHAVFIGYVVRSHPTLGTIDVSIQNGYELNELHGVQITTPTDNQGLFYNSTSTLWENKSITTALGYTPVPTTRNITINGVTYDLSADRTWTIAAGISGSGAAGQVTYWTGASAVSGSNNLFWDNTNGRLGIGTNAPATILDISSNGGRLRFTQNIAGSTFVGLEFATNLGVSYAALIANQNTGEIRLSTNASYFPTFYSSGAEAMRISTQRNLLIGFTTDQGTRLAVSGDTLLRGSGNTSATTALTVQNSSSTNLLTVRNDGLVTMGASVMSSITSTNLANFVFSLGNFALDLQTTNPNSAASTILTSGAITRTDNQVKSIININNAVTSTAANFNTLNGFAFTSTISQTLGIIRGLWIAPTLTASTDFRAIETSAGNVLFGASGTGFFWDNANSRLGIGTNAPSKTLDVRGAVRIETTGTTELDMFGGGGNILRISCSSTTPFIGTLTNAPLGFFTSATERGRFTTNGNLMLGTTSDLAVRLGVVGDTILRGSGASNITTALTVQNSSSQNIFIVRNDRRVGINTINPEVTFDVRGVDAGIFLFRDAPEEAFINIKTGTTASSTGVELRGLATQKGFRFCDSTNANNNYMQLWSSGNLTLETNTRASYSDIASALLQVNSTTKGFLPPRMTTTQKNAIATPAAGLVVYDTTLNKLCVYTTAWETITSI